MLIKHLKGDSMKNLRCLIVILILLAPCLDAMDRNEVAHCVKALLEVENKRNAQRWAQPSEKPKILKATGSQSDEGSKAIERQISPHKSSSLNQPITVKPKPVIKTFVAGSNKQEMVIVQE